MSFWKYFSEVLKWRPILKPGPLQVLPKGTARRLDDLREDAIFLRAQWFTQLCEAELVPDYGLSRGLFRHKSETAEQFRQRVTNAYAWHLLGGKQEGVPEILRFYGFETLEIENLRKYQTSRWAEFQVGLKTPQTLAEQNLILEDLETLVWLINEYKPARSILARLYTDIYNINPLIWSEGQYSEHFYSHFSGVPASTLGEGWQDEDLQLSFGLRFVTEAKRLEGYGIPVFFGLEGRSFIAPYIDAPIWSQFHYGDEFPQKHGFTIGELFSLDWCERLSASYPWSGPWDGRPWTEYTRWGRILPKWRMYNQEISRVQLVYSDPFVSSTGGRWGGLNACYGRPKAVLIDNPLIWGKSRYSEDTLRREITIHEQSIATKGITTPVPTRNSPTSQIKGHSFAQTNPLGNQEWSGSWDDRRWYDYQVFFGFN